MSYNPKSFLPRFQGAPVGLHVLEVRDSSAVVLWDPPAFVGRTPVNGYYMDIKEACAGVEGWRAVHEKANKMKYMKVRTVDSYTYITSA